MRPWQVHSAGLPRGTISATQHGPQVLPPDDTPEPSRRAKRKSTLVHVVSLLALGLQLHCKWHSATLGQATSSNVVCARHGCALAAGARHRRAEPARMPPVHSDRGQDLLLRWQRQLRPLPACQRVGACNVALVSAEPASARCGEQQPRPTVGPWAGSAARKQAIHLWGARWPRGPQRHLCLGRR